jgi:hypothetical protein
MLQSNLTRSILASSFDIFKKQKSLRILRDMHQFTAKFDIHKHGKFPMPDERF